MSTRIWLPSTTVAPPIVPGSWSAGWNKTTGGAADTIALLTPWTESFGNFTNISDNVYGHFIAIRRWMLPLGSQTISGTVKGQILCQQQFSADAFTLALGLKVIKLDGSDRGVLLAVAASDSAAVPPVWVNNDPDASLPTNRRFLDASEGAAITLSSLNVARNDCLVIEVGFRHGGGGFDQGQITLRADSSVGDLPENDTSEADLNTWIEFSDGLRVLNPLLLTDYSQFPKYKLRGANL